jgi:membrane protease YdiL (CAAX protease family)
MRRHFLWYGLAAAWTLAALAGFLHGHVPEAAPALATAVVFAAVGVAMGRRDAGLRQRAPRIRRDRES